MGMFEQSILLDHAAGKRTGALAASITAQTLAVGVVIVLPLIYSDRLPNWRPSTAISIPFMSPPPPGPVVETASSSSSRPSLVPQRIWHPPSRITPLSEMPEITEADAPPVFSRSGPGVPGGTGDPSTLLSQIIAPITPLPPKPKPVVETAPAPTAPIVVSKGVQEAKLIRRVMPIYPPLARQARISGTVRLNAIIAKDGTMQQVQLVSGPPLLVKAALDAVGQWLYRPTLLNGQPVEVIAPIDVIFTLSP
jgi:protein TonB